MVYKCECMSVQAMDELLSYWYSKIAPVSKVAVSQIVELEIELERRCGR
jgi:hypothetical protein